MVYWIGQGVKGGSARAPADCSEEGAAEGAARGRSIKSWRRLNVSWKALPKPGDQTLQAGARAPTLMHPEWPCLDLAKTSTSTHSDLASSTFNRASSRSSRLAAPTFPVHFRPGKDTSSILHHLSRANGFLSRGSADRIRYREGESLGPNSSTEDPGSIQVADTCSIQVPRAPGWCAVRGERRL